jgi:hypothetical protein
LGNSFRVRITIAIPKARKKHSAGEEHESSDAHCAERLTATIDKDDLSNLKGVLRAAEEVQHLAVTEAAQTLP